MKRRTNLLNKILVYTGLFLIVLCAVSGGQAQQGSVDLSFNATPATEIAENQLSQIGLTVQPDGKTLVYGDTLIIGGAAQNRIVRLNQDGTLDASFNYTDRNSWISSAVIQPNGKILVAGYILGYNPIPGYISALVRRLNSDGTIDSTFTEFYSPQQQPATSQGRATVWAIQPDGKILLSVHLTFSNQNIIYIYRLNANGGLDSAFTPILFDSGGTQIASYITKIVLQTDGKFLVGSRTMIFSGSGRSLRRYNPDGTPDSTFVGQSISANSFSSSYIGDFIVGADNSIIIAGFFDTVNSTNRNNIAKLLPNGALDPAFTSPLGTADAVNRLAFAPNNQIIVSTQSKFVRLNSNGAVDNSFNSSSDVTQIGAWGIDGAGRIIFIGRVVENGMPTYRVGRLNLNGSLDNSFGAALGAPGSISTLTAQTDGKIIAAGDFTQMNGVPRRGLARLNADGSVDSTFDPGSGFRTSVGTNSPPSSIIVQPDGKILAAGSFSSYNGASRPSLARLNPDGSLDAAFNVNVGALNDVALQPDGKIVISGSFNTVNGVARPGLARLHADGTLDASFNAVVGGSQFAGVRGILAQSDGKIVISGGFTTVNDVIRLNVARLNSDGTLDHSFDAGTSVSSGSQVKQLPDGKYMASLINISRLNNNGTIDGTFVTPSVSGGSIYDFIVQPDGKVIIGGSFATVNGIQRPKIARLNADGSLDTSFVPGGANGDVFAIVRQPGGKVIVGGFFTSIGGVTRIGIARLNAALPTAFDFDGDGRAEISVFRPSNGYWYRFNSSNNSFFAVQFGQTSDKPAPADYDGDGKTDIAVFREGAFAYFYILNSADNTFRFAQFGTTGDTPTVGDWDGDGRADLAVYRGGNTTGAQSNFYYRPSGTAGVDYLTITNGTGGRPVVGDFDGDGKVDPTLFLPSAVWSIRRSSDNQLMQATFGVSSDIPVPADYDGDGKTNIAVFRPSNGTWYTSQNVAINYGAIQFGANGDVPVPADYDGDGRADAAVFRPTNGAWYLNRTTSGFTGVAFGQAGDKPVPNAYVP